MQKLSTKGHVGIDKQVKSNQSFATKILHLKTNLRKTERGELQGNIQKEIDKLENFCSTSAKRAAYCSGKE